MKLIVKNMVGDPSIAAVQAALEKLGIHPLSVAVGEIVLELEKVSADTLHRLDAELQAEGFELVDARKSRIIEQIKDAALTLVYRDENTPKRKQSEIISRALHLDYPYLSNLFSHIEGITIKQFITRQKLEKAKEFLVYGDMPLSDIAEKLGYSSAAHLSAQFKKVTGLPPSHFKRLGSKVRR